MRKEHSCHCPVKNQVLFYYEEYKHYPLKNGNEKREFMSLPCEETKLKTFNTELVASNCKG